jgi:hypothetical protein
VLLGVDCDCGAGVEDCEFLEECPLRREDGVEDISMSLCGLRRKSEDFESFRWRFKGNWKKRGARVAFKFASRVKWFLKSWHSGLAALTYPVKSELIHLPTDPTHFLSQITNHSKPEHSTTT